MTEFDKAYWDEHWHRPETNRGPRQAVNPYLLTETRHLSPTTALDAGCGIGTEALWLALRGWRVTAVDISTTALATARARAMAADAGPDAGAAGAGAAGAGAADAGADARAGVEWVEADLARWNPTRTWDLVFTGYTHADIDQLALYRRIASWVAPGGSVLVVGHLRSRHRDDHAGSGHPEDATATVDGITGLFGTPEWQIEAAYTRTRTSNTHGDPARLHDVIVRARRRSSPP